MQHAGRIRTQQESGQAIEKEGMVQSQISASFPVAFRVVRGSITHTKT